MKSDERIEAIRDMNNFVMKSKRLAPVKRFNIERIVSAVETTSGRMYEVKWKGYDDSHNTLESEYTLFEDVPDLIRNFNFNPREEEEPEVNFVDNLSVS